MALNAHMIRSKLEASLNAQGGVVSLQFESEHACVRHLSTRVQHWTCVVQAQVRGIRLTNALSLYFGTAASRRHEQWVWKCVQR
jgi:hypothetical protein